MTADKIIISFDDNDNSDNQKIEINLNDSAPQSFDVISAFPFGNKGYSLCTDSMLDFPSGIDRSFGIEFNLNLKKIFINSLLESGRFIVLSSVDGSIFLIEKFTGKLFYKFYFENEKFEKSGIVLNDILYINSIQKIFSLDARFKPNDTIPSDNVSPSVFYTAPDGFFIWSSLNEFNGNIIFMIFSPSDNIANIINLNQNGLPKVLFSFKPAHFINGEILASDNYLFTLFDDQICILNHNSSLLIKNNFLFSYDVFPVLINNDLFFNSPEGEIFTLNINSPSPRFTGIKTPVINSIAASGDIIFIGNSSGWSAFNKNGFEIYSHIDIDKNILLSLGKNILAVSAGNKIILHNISNFPEAQLFSLNDVIVSARVSNNSVFVLSKSGLLQSFKNNMLIIHI